MQPLKSRTPNICCLNDCIIVKFGQPLGSGAADTPVNICERPANQIPVSHGYFAV